MYYDNAIIKKNFKEKKDLFYCSISACILSSLSSIMHPSLTGFAILNLVIFFNLIVVWEDKLFFLIDVIYRFSRRRKFMRFIYAVGGTLSFLDALSMPAFAQFYVKAEDFIKDDFLGENGDENTKKAVATVFVALRVLLLLYIAVALIFVIIQLRNNEDWMSAAKLPLMVVVVVTLGDVLTGVVIGETGGGKGGGVKVEET